MNPTPFSPDDEPLAQSLLQLKPSRTPLDPATVFYRMGLEAGRQQQTRSVWPAAAALVLAAALSAVIVGPVGYRLGQASSGPSEPAAPDAEVLPLSPPRTMLAQSEPASAIEQITNETAEPRQTDVATLPAPSPAPNPEEPTPEPLTDRSSLSWPSLNTAIANWLWGDALDRRNPEHDFMLTRRLTIGHSAADWFNDGVNSPKFSARPPDAASDANPDINRSVPRPQRREPLRASDWKEIIDNKHQVY